MPIDGVILSGVKIDYKTVDWAPQANSLIW